MVCKRNAIHSLDFNTRVCSRIMNIFWCVVFMDKNVSHSSVMETSVPPPSSSTQNTKFFSVPRHTPVILAESADCGSTLMRFLCGDAGGSHETRNLNNYCPIWVMDIVCQVSLYHRYPLLGVLHCNAPCTSGSHSIFVVTSSFTSLVVY